jgi:acid stress-induced BolA-like protein IbaG/YrbA
MAVVSTDEIKQRIEDGLPDATAEVTGDGQHFRAEVVSPAFSGLSRIQQHKLVYEVFGDELGARIHALSLKTTTE